MPLDRYVDAAWNLCALVGAWTILRGVIWHVRQAGRHPTERDPPGR